MNRRGPLLSLLACVIGLSDAAAPAPGQPLYPARTVRHYQTEFTVTIDRHVARAQGLQQREQVP